MRNAGAWTVAVSQTGNELGLSLHEVAAFRPDELDSRLDAISSRFLATGAHLDFRVVKRGAFVDPTGEKFIPGDPIPADERAAFRRHARDLVRRLEDQAGFE